MAKHKDTINSVITAYIVLSNIVIAIGSAYVFDESHEIAKDSKCNEIFFSSLGIGISSVIIVFTFIGFILYKFILSLCGAEITINFTMIRFLVLAAVIVANISSVLLWFTIGQECKDYYKQEYSDLWTLFLAQMINVLVTSFIIIVSLIYLYKKKQYAEID